MAEDKNIRYTYRILMNLNLRRNISITIVAAFLVNTLGSLPVYAQEAFFLPAPGHMVALSPAFSPAVLKGIKLDPKNPFRFHFFVDRGDSSLSQEELKKESAKLFKYFLASLTIPEKELWVNLSPYEKDRIVPQEFGRTEMGRDLLAEDYMLKQITASLIYPEDKIGKEFWQKVYAQAQAQYGTTNIPINTFNKVWIVPEKAVVYENGGVAFVLENHLKVMLEQDYLSLEKHTGIASEPVQAKDTNQIGSQIVREIVIPALTKEVNEGKNFSQLRQVFYSLILATWYKKKIKDSILNKVYSNRNKISGVNVSVGDKDKIYQEYLKAFKKGVYNFIKEEHDPLTNQSIPRKYFSGGVSAEYEERTITPVGPLVFQRALFDGHNKMRLVDTFGEVEIGLEKKDSSPTTLKIGQTDGAMKASILDRWQRIKERVRIDDHITFRFYSHISSLSWEEIKYDELRSLKGLVKRAQKEFPAYLTEAVIQKALNDTNGALDLIRYCHPYTLETLRNPDAKVQHFLYHEATYYRLFADKLMGKLGPEPVVVINMDPHSDDRAYPEDKKNYTILKGSSGLSKEVFWTSGINDANWAGAAVRDDLANEVIQIKYDNDWKEWHAYKITKVQQYLSYEILVSGANLKDLFHKMSVHHSIKSAYLTIDQDSFSQAGSHDEKPFTMSLDSIRTQISDLKSALEAQGINTQGNILTAASLDYTEGLVGWSDSVEKIIEEIFDVAQLAPSSSEKGGIDLNPAQMSMKVKKNGQDFKFDFNGTEIDAAQVTGATFTIRTMTPVTNLLQILGLNLEPADKWR